MGPQRTIMLLMPIFVNKLKPQRIFQAFQQAIARHSRHEFSSVLYIESLHSTDAIGMTFELSSFDSVVMQDDGTQLPPDVFHHLSIVQKLMVMLLEVSSTRVRARTRTRAHARTRARTHIRTLAVIRRVK
jgi:hypothetical protein